MDFLNFSDSNWYVSHVDSNTVTQRARQLLLVSHASDTINIMITYENVKGLLNNYKTYEAFAKAFTEAVLSSEPEVKVSPADIFVLHGCYQKFIDYIDDKYPCAKVSASVNLNIQ